MQLAQTPDRTSANLDPASETGEFTARDRLIKHTLWLVHSIAVEILRVHRLSIAREDLVSCGMRGLVQAANSFDHRPGVQFSTFAYYRIRGAMLDAIEEGQGVCSRAEVSRMREIATTEESFPNALPRERSMKRLTLSFNGSAECLPSEVDYRANAIKDREDPVVAADRRLDCQRARKAVAALPSRERQIVELLYFEHDNSFEAVAKHLGVTRPHIFRIHARAITRLRGQLSGQVRELLGDAHGRVCGDSSPLA